MQNIELKQGDRFHGYVVERLLGRGGIGAVYLVKHEILGTYYALKLLDPQVVKQDATYLARFLREARIATRIRHPNLVTVHDCGHDGDTDLYYLVMDYVPGGSLRDEIGMQGHLDIARASAIVAQVASALKAAQQFHVVHRDIKPENIMIQPDGLVKLVDLGIAKAADLDDSLQTTDDAFFGTPTYISPEQAQCSANVDLRADIYSLGIVFFEMLSGSCPYTGSNPAQIIGQIVSDDPTPDVRDFRRDIPPEVAVLVRRMTQKDRERRLQSYDAVLKELSHLDGVKVEIPEGQTEIAAQPAPSMGTLIRSVSEISGNFAAQTKKNAQPKWQAIMKSPLAMVVMGVLVAAIVFVIMKLCGI